VTLTGAVAAAVTRRSPLVSSVTRLIRGRCDLARALLTIAALGAGILAIATAIDRGVDGGAAILALPYAFAALGFAAAALTHEDAARSRTFALGAGLVLCAWVVAIGYGRLEAVANIVALVGAVASISTLSGGRAPRAEPLGVVLVVAAVVLVYIRITHAPLGLVAPYGIAAVGTSVMTLALLAAMARRRTGVVIGVVALAWIAAMALLLFLFGPPLGAG
jgi:hypothetical protein